MNQTNEPEEIYTISRIAEIAWTFCSIPDLLKESQKESENIVKNMEESDKEIVIKKILKVKLTKRLKEIESEMEDLETEQNEIETLIKEDL